MEVICVGSTGLERFQLPADWVAEHPLLNWPVDIPSDLAMREGLAVSLLHTSALYENRSHFPDTTPGVLSALASLGSSFFRHHASLLGWRDHPAEENGQLSARLAGQVSGARHVLLGEEWLRGSVVMGRGQAGIGFSAGIAHIQFCQIVGWYVLADDWAIAARLVDLVLTKIEAAGAALGEPMAMLQKLLPKGIQPDLTESREGPDHAATFTATLKLPGYATVTASGANKKQARRNAAAASLLKNFPGGSEGDAGIGGGFNHPRLMTPRLASEQRISLYRLRAYAGLDERWSALLEQALVHGSWFHENRPLIDWAGQSSNARLAFLGSNTLALESCLPTVRKALQQRSEIFSLHTATAQTNFEAAEVLGLPDALYLGRGQRRRIEVEMVADAFQAFHAVVTLALGGALSNGRASGRWAEALEIAATENDHEVDMRTRLQNYGAACGLAQAFEVERRGADHAAQFSSALTLSSGILQEEHLLHGTWVGSATGARAHASEIAVEVLDALCTANPPVPSGLGTFLVRHLIATASITGLPLRRWIHVGLFGSRFAADLEALRNWATSMDEFCAESEIHVSLADIDRLAAHFRVIAAQGRQHDGLLDSLRGLADRVAAAKLGETIAPGELAILVRDLAWLTTALRGRNADHPQCRLGVALDSLRFLHRADIELGQPSVDAFVNATMQEAIGLWLRGLRDLSAIPPSITVTVDAETVSLTADVKDLDGTAWNHLTVLVAAIEPSVALSDPPTPSLRIAVLGRAQITQGGPIHEAVNASVAPNSQAIDSTVSSLLHDVKNELSGALAARRAEPGTLTEAARQQLRVREHLDRAAALMIDAMARTGLLRASLEGDCNLQSTLADYLHGLGTSLPAGIRRDFALPSSPFIVPLPEATVMAVLGNAVKNSLEAMDGRGLLQVHCDVFEGEGAVIEIVDSGPGFPSEVIDAFQADRMTSTKQSGNAIGLLAIKQVVSAIGGDVALKNLPIGASLEITLPSALPSETDDE